MELQITGVPNNYEIEKIFEFVKNDINFCDTALAYGNAHKLLGSKGFQIITKLIF